jgi:hypothetical protein
MSVEKRFAQVQKDVKQHEPKGNFARQLGFLLFLRSVQWASKKD